MDVKCIGFILIAQLALSNQQAAPPLNQAVLSPQSAAQHLLHPSSANTSPDISKEKRGLAGIADSVHQGSSSVISLPIHLGRHYPLGVHRSLGVPLPVPLRVTVPRSYPLTVLVDPTTAALEYILGVYSGHHSSSSLDYNTLLTYLSAVRAASHLSSSTAHAEHSALANYAALTAAAAAKLV